MNITINPDLSSTIISADGLSVCNLPNYNPETLLSFSDSFEVQAFINDIQSNPDYFHLVPNAAQVAAFAAEKIVHLEKSIVDATTKRLDDFAATRNYGSILSACSYANSTIPKFLAEGIYCVQARDATWTFLYSYLAEVQAGTQPMPTGYADVEPLLPVLAWTN